MIKVLSNDSVQLCCKGKSCPIVTYIGNGLVEILDDYGKTVTMTKEQSLQLSDGVKVIAEQQEKKELLLG